MVKVTSQSRTSSNAWCRSECEDLPGVKQVTERIEEVSFALLGLACMLVLLIQAAPSKRVITSNHLASAWAPC